MTYEELNEAIRYLEEEKLVSEATLYGENQDKYDNTIMLIDDAKFRESRKPLTIYDRAIMALEQTELNPSYNSVKTELDCISRQAVLEYIEGSGAELGHGSENELVCQDIKNLPFVTPQTSWIPVSERLPKDGQKVLVTTRSGNIIDVDTSIFYHASAFWKHYVIAWMPLPPSYQGESEDKE